jgi:hypothetical protein
MDAMEEGEPEKIAANRQNKTDDDATSFNVGDTIEFDI